MAAAPNVSMGVLDSFFGNGNPWAIEKTWGAGRMVPKPWDHQLDGQILGHYRQGLVTGNVAAAGANGPIFSVRWVDATRFMAITRLILSAVVAGAVTAQVTDVDFIKVTGFTVSDSGGTQLLPAAGQKARTANMGSSLLASGDLRAASTGALTAGTRTLDPNPLGMFGLGFGSPGMTTVGSVAGPFDMYKVEPNGEHPLYLAQNEGIIVRTPTSIATGSIKYYLTVCWAELCALAF